MNDKKRDDVNNREKKRDKRYVYCFFAKGLTGVLSNKGSGVILRNINSHTCWKVCSTNQRTQMLVTIYWHDWECFLSSHVNILLLSCLCYL